MTPLDTPPDWFTRIAQREREWRELGPAEALRLRVERDGLTSHVRAVAESVFGVKADG